MKKLDFNLYVEKYFSPLGKGKFISLYEEQVCGFSARDLSHYSKKDLEQSYGMYLDGSEDFLKYDE